MKDNALSTVMLYKNNNRNNEHNNSNENNNEIVFSSNNCSNCTFDNYCFVTDNNNNNKNDNINNNNNSITANNNTNHNINNNNINTTNYNNINDINNNNINTTTNNNNRIIYININNKNKLINEVKMNNGNDIITDYSLDNYFINNNNNKNINNSINNNGNNSNNILNNNVNTKAWNVTQQINKNSNSFNNSLNFNAFDNGNLNTANNNINVNYFNYNNSNINTCNNNCNNNDSGFLKLGSRVIVGNKSQLGVLRYIGTVHFKEGLWCGIELDEETGLHDGIVSGLRYFTCPPKKGLFAPFSKIGPQYFNTKIRPKNHGILFECPFEKSPDIDMRSRLPRLIKKPIFEKEVSSIRNKSASPKRVTFDLSPSSSPEVLVGDRNLGELLNTDAKNIKENLFLDICLSKQNLNNKNKEIETDTEEILNKIDQEISCVETPDTAEIKSFAPNFLDFCKNFDDDKNDFNAKFQSQTEIPKEISHDLMNSNYERDKTLLNSHNDDGIEKEKKDINYENITKKPTFVLAQTAIAQYAELLKASQLGLENQKAKLIEKPTTNILYEISSNSRKLQNCADHCQMSSENNEARHIHLPENGQTIESPTSIDSSPIGDFEIFDGEELSTIKLVDENYETEDFLLNYRYYSNRTFSSLNDQIEPKPNFNITTSKERVEKEKNEVCNFLDNLLKTGKELEKWLEISVSEMEEENDRIINKNDNSYLGNKINNKREPNQNIQIQNNINKNDNIDKYDGKTKRDLNLEITNYNSNCKNISIANTADDIDGYFKKSEFEQSLGNNSRPVSLVSTIESYDTGCPMELEYKNNISKSSTMDDDDFENFEPAADNLLTESWNDIFKSQISNISSENFNIDSGIYSEIIKNNNKKNNNDNREVALDANDDFTNNPIWYDPKSNFENTTEIKDLNLINFDETSLTDKKVKPETISSLDTLALFVSADKSEERLGSFSSYGSNQADQDLVPSELLDQSFENGKLIKLEDLNIDFILDFEQSTNNINESLKNEMKLQSMDEHVKTPIADFSNCFYNNGSNNTEIVHYKEKSNNYVSEFSDKNINENIRKRNNLKQLNLSTVKISEEKNHEEKLIDVSDKNTLNKNQIETVENRFHSLSAYCSSEHKKKTKIKSFSQTKNTSLYVPSDKIDDFEIKYNCSSLNSKTEKTISMNNPGDDINRTNKIVKCDVKQNLLKSKTNKIETGRKKSIDKSHSLTNSTSSSLQTAIELKNPKLKKNKTNTKENTGKKSNTLISKKLSPQSTSTPNPETLNLNVSADGNVKITVGAKSSNSDNGKNTKFGSKEQQIMAKNRMNILAPEKFSKCGKSPSSESEALHDIITDEYDNKRKNSYKMSSTKNYKYENLKFKTESFKDIKDTKIENNANGNQQKVSARIENRNNVSHDDDSKTKYNNQHKNKSLYNNDKNNIYKEINDDLITNIRKTPIKDRNIKVKSTNNVDIKIVPKKSFASNKISNGSSNDLKNITKFEQRDKLTKLEKCFEEKIERLKMDLNSKHENIIGQLEEKHRKEIEILNKNYKEKIEVIENLTKNHQREFNNLNSKHLVHLQEFQSKHNCELEELMNKYEKSTLYLEEQISVLKNELASSEKREKKTLELSSLDKELKVQLELEVKSLQAVLEQKIEELKTLRKKHIILEEKVKEIPALNEKMSKLQAQMENMELMMARKLEHEKELIHAQQALIKQNKTGSDEIKRLSMDKEELIYRLTQSDVGQSMFEKSMLSSSLPLSSSLNSSPNHSYYNRSYSHNQHSVHQQGRIGNM